MKSFYTYNDGFIVNKNKINNNLKYSKLKAIYSFEKDLKKLSDLTNTVSIEIDTKRKNFRNSALINYSLKVMTLILNRSVDFEVIIYDQREESDDYALFLTICFSINMLLEKKIETIKLLREISYITALNKERLKMANNFNLIYLNQGEKVEDKINLSARSVLDRLINQKNVNEIIVKSSYPSVLQVKGDLDKIDKYYFTIEEA